MFPYNGRPTEEFLREYRNKLNELQELMESQGLKLEIKSGGRCIVVPEVKAGFGKSKGVCRGRKGMREWFVGVWVYYTCHAGTPNNQRPRAHHRSRSEIGGSLPGPSSISIPANVRRFRYR